jgi:hypothetical protein
MSEMGPGCVKTLTLNSRVRIFRLDFVDAETNCTDNFCRKKAIEKQFCASLARARFHTASVKLGPRAVHLARQLSPLKADIHREGRHVRFVPNETSDNRHSIGPQTRYENRL